MLISKVSINLENHKALRAVLEGAAGKSTQDLLDYWEVTYKSFILLRFDIFAAGGGNWRKLKPATIRRKGHGTILIDTEAMRLGLAEGIGVINRKTMSITMGFTNEAAHPKSKLNIAELLTAHNEGLGPPKRQILVLPTDSVMRTLRQGTAKRMANIANGK